MTTAELLAFVKGLPARLAAIENRSSVAGLEARVSALEARLRDLEEHSASHAGWIRAIRKAVEL